MTRSKQLIDFSKVIGGSTRPAFKTAAVSLIALTVAIASAHATDTTIDANLGSSYSEIYGNNAGGTDYDIPSGSPSSNRLTFNAGAKATRSSFLYIIGENT